MEDQQPAPNSVTRQEQGSDPVGHGTKARVPVLENHRRRDDLDRNSLGKQRRRPEAGAAGPQSVRTDSGNAETDDLSAAVDTGEPVTDGARDAGNDVSPPCRSRRGQAVLVGAAIAAFIGSVAIASPALHNYLDDRATASTRTEVARTAVAAVTTLWTYTPETVDSLADRATQYLSGDFNVQYRKFMDAAAGPNQQAQVTDSTEVVGAGVESLKGSDAVAIVFTNTTATSPLSNNVPSLKYIGYRLTMKREDSRWLVTSMATVTFTDLTPQI